MWAVMELRRGDILQTYAVYRDKQHAELRMIQLMNQYNHPDSWWKLADVPNDVVNPNVDVNQSCKIAVWCNWEDDNAIQILGIYTLEQEIPEEVQMDDDVWVDEVLLR